MKNTTKAYSILIVAIIFFCVDYYFRISLSLVVPQLIQKFQLTAFGVAAFSSLYYLGYLAMQIPAAYIYEKKSTHIILFISIFICTLSYIAFIYSRPLSLAYILRFITGAAAAFSLIGVLFIAKNHFPEKWFAFIAGVAITLATLISSLAQIISSSLLDHYSWQTALVYVAFFGIFISFFILALKIKKGRRQSESTSLPIHQQVILFIKNRSLLINAIVGGLMFLPTTIFDSLWGISFMHRYYALSKLSGATGITILFIGWAVGTPLFGFLSGIVKKISNLLVIGALLAAVDSVFLIYVNYISITYIYTLLFLLGFFSGTQVLVWRIFIKYCPKNIVGASIGATNMLIMLVVAAFHLFAGGLLSLDTSSINYKVGLGTMPLVFLLSLILVRVCIRDY